MNLEVALPAGMSASAAVGFKRGPEAGFKTASYLPTVLVNDDLNRDPLLEEMHLSGVDDLQEKLDQLEKKFAEKLDSQMRAKKN